MATRALNTINLDDLEKFAKTLRDIEPLMDKLLAIIPHLDKLQAIADKSGDVLPVERELLRSGDVAKFLCMSQSEVTTLVKHGYLTPCYTPNSGQRKFKISDVKALVKDKPWQIEGDNHD